MADPTPTTRRTPDVVWTLAIEYYTIAEARRMLHLTNKTIYELIEREEDPMPFRMCVGSQRGALIHRDDLREWMLRNTVLVRDGRPSHARRQGR